VSRRTARAAVLLSALTTPLLLAGPAWADNDPVGPLEGGDTTAEVSSATALVLFVLVPLLILLVISGIAYALGGGGQKRYRPQRGGWSAAPVWFAGPPDAATAVETADPALSERSGASGSW